MEDRLPTQTPEEKLLALVAKLEADVKSVAQEWDKEKIDRMRLSLEIAEQEIRKAKEELKGFRVYD